MDSEISSRIVEYSGMKLFMKVEKSGKIMKIIASDGKSVWESSKISWDDLIRLKPDGIDESIQSASISIAIFGEKPENDESELKEDDLVVEMAETAGGNLNISWKLKQILGITIVLGAIILLKLSESDAASKLLELLEQSALSSKLTSQLKEATDLNKKLLDEYEKVVKEKVACEQELYTKFRILLNKIKDE